MTRYGPQFGPDLTFLGVDRVDLVDSAALAAADVVVVGAPFDGGTSHRPGTRFGPMAIRVAGIDVVEVSPPYDHAEITAFLANRVCLEALSGLAARRHGITHDPAGPLLEGR